MFIVVDGVQHWKASQPLRWMSPESLTQPPTYNFKTDVWSYGITVWEIYSRGIRHIQPLIELYYNELLWHQRSVVASFNSHFCNLYVDNVLSPSVT